ncbi:MAG TPA: N-acetyltransferase [Planctomycetes bacterium]|nr:N-acetyltransferase [Planctomycetota bacterium]
MIGFCDLEDLDAVDVGYRFLPGYWGQGLATEACLASVTFGFEVLGLNRIVGFVLPENVASIRVLEKVGMSSEGEVTYDGLRILRYSIHK